jgi:pimeloyl-ACP methyl ester carboxylesterase
MNMNAQAQGKFPFDVKISGSGSGNIIFIPGLSCSGDVWNETVARFNKEYTCYVLTFHGFAGVAPDDTASFRGWENGIARYIRENKISKPIIVGHSIGGGMALLLAADYPELISKIVVVDALPCLSAISNPNFISDPHPDCSPFIQRFTNMTDAQFYQMQKQTMPALMADTVHLEEALQWSVKSDRKTMAEIYCQFLNLDLRDTLSSIQCPSLILLEGSFKGIESTVSGQYEKLKNAELQYADKGLHFIMYDDPDWYFKQLNQFLK